MHPQDGAAYSRSAANDCGETAARSQVQPGTFYVYSEKSLGEKCRLHEQCYHGESWVSQHLSERGLRRVPRWSEAEFVWTFSAEYGYNLSIIQDTQAVNHIGNVFQLLADKGKLFSTVRKYNSVAGCSGGFASPLPWTADVADAAQCGALVQRLRAGPAGPWLLKPRAGSGGSGIRLFQSGRELLDDVLGHAGAGGGAAGCREFSAGEADVAQEYIANPLTLKALHGRKFNLRAYALISSVKPFVAFMHRDGYAGTSMHKYNASAEDLGVHLTGMHTQAKDTAYDAEERVISWGRLASMIEEELQGVEVVTGGLPFIEWLRQQTKRVVLWLLYSAKPGLVGSRGSFNVLAFDLLLDDQMRLWVLEANAYPWLSWETEWGKTWMHGLIDEMLDIQLEVFDKKRAGKRLESLESPQAWEVIANEDSGEELFPYGSCPEELSARPAEPFRLSAPPRRKGRKASTSR